MFFNDYSSTTRLEIVFDRDIVSFNKQDTDFDDKDNTLGKNVEERGWYIKKDSILYKITRIHVLRSHCIISAMVMAKPNNTIRRDVYPDIRYSLFRFQQ